MWSALRLFFEGKIAMNWFETWEQQNKVSKDAAAAREATGSVKTKTPKAERKLFTRNQWKATGRRVIVGDPEAKQVVTARAGGRTLCLFSLEQTAKWPN